MLHMSKLVFLVSFSLVFPEGEGAGQTKNPTSRWVNNTVPYIIGKNFTVKQIEKIKSEMEMFHNKTCLRWVDYGAKPGVNISAIHHVEFRKVYTGFCATSISYRNHNKTYFAIVELRDYCFRRNSVIHEMMHALGFFVHEHQRFDRDCYVQISPKAVPSYAFDIKRQEPWAERYPYDLFSVLHYDRDAYVRSLKEVQTGQVEIIGNHGDLTPLDLSKTLFKFCGGPHYCDVKPDDCRLDEDFKKRSNCVNKTSG